MQNFRELNLVETESVAGGAAVSDPDPHPWASSSMVFDPPPWPWAPAIYG